MKEFFYVTQNEAEINRVKCMDCKEAGWYIWDTSLEFSMHGEPIGPFVNQDAAKQFSDSSEYEFKLNAMRTA